MSNRGIYDMTDVTPRYTNNCPHCVFLGRYKLQGTCYDLYYCWSHRTFNSGRPIVIGFKDNTGYSAGWMPVDLSNITSSIAWFSLNADGHTAIAYERAKEQGLV